MAEVTTVESVNLWFIEKKDVLTKYNVVIEFCKAFGSELDTLCNGLSLFTKLSRNMTKIKAQKRNKKDLQFLNSEFTLPATATATAMTALEKELLISKNKLLMKESKSLKRQLESEEDLQEKSDVQYKCMEELSDNLSQIIIGKTIVEDELKRLKSDHFLHIP